MGIGFKDIFVLVFLITLVAFGFWTFANDSMRWYNEQGEETSLPNSKYADIFDQVSANATSTFTLTETMQEKVRTGKKISGVELGIAVLTTAFEVTVTMPFRILNVLTYYVFLFAFPLMVPLWIVNLVTGIIMAVIIVIILSVIVRYKM